MRRYIKPRLLQNLALLGLAIVVTGCASTATVNKQSRLNKTSSPQELSVDVPRGTVMAVIRYPAFIDAAAEDKFYNLYANRTIGATSSSDDAGFEEVSAIADIMIIKSNYFALSLFKELTKRVPEHSVLLSPHAITLDENGKLTSEPMTQAENLPNVVMVDFAAYTFPDAKRILEGELASFGDIITPLVTVRTDHRGSATTQGVLLTSRPTLRGAVANGRQTMRQSLVNIEEGKLDGNIPELDFITYLNNTFPTRVFYQKLSTRPDQNTISTLPIERIKLDGEIINSFSDANVTLTDPLEKKFSAGLANQIVGIINRMDIKKASMAGYAGAISQFDQSLAALTLIGSNDDDYQSRLRFAERFLEAEQTYLSVQSLRLFDGVYNGELGSQVRDTLKAEYNILEIRRDLARKQNLTAGLAALSTIGAAAVIASGGRPRGCGQSGTQNERIRCRQRQSSSQGPQGIAGRIKSNALINGALIAGSQAFSYKRQGRLIGSNYFASIIPALDEQISVQLDLIESNETITAIRFEDFRDKLKTLYDEKKRGLKTAATRCEYTHSEALPPGDKTSGTWGLGKTVSGVWVGVCENGLANGAGVGVLRNGSGSGVEYYGYAENGKPQGAGYMIIHELNGSYTLEGQFENGLAEGVMRVSKAGKDDVNRLYRLGQDTGAAPRGKGAVSPF